MGNIFSYGQTALYEKQVLPKSASSTKLENLENIETILSDFSEEFNNLNIKMTSQNLALCVESGNKIGIQYTIESLLLEPNIKIKLDTLKEKLTLNPVQLSNLVFSGGGLKGIAEIGALLVIRELLLNKCITIPNHIITHTDADVCDFKGFAGTSMGSVIAVLLAVGYTSQEILDLTLNLDFNKFKDDNSNFLIDIYSLLKTYGWCPGNTLEEYIGVLVKNKTGNAAYTFQDLYETSKKTLIIVGTDINAMKPVYFSHKTYPSMPIKDAVRISTSIPVFYKPMMVDVHAIDNSNNIVVNNKTNDDKTNDDKTNDIKINDNKIIIQSTNLNIAYPAQTPNQHYFVDGGVLDNYAIHVFDTEQYGKNYYKHHQCQRTNCTKCYYSHESWNKETIGIRILNEQFEELTEGKFTEHNIPITNIKDYMYALFEVLLYGNDQFHMNNEFWNRTISVKSFFIPLTTFELSPKQKTTLLNNGIMGGIEFFEQK